MEIKNIQDGTKLTVQVSGRVDTQTAPDLQSHLEKSIDGITELVLDFSDVNYISSAGLRTIVTAQNWMDKKNGEMKVTGVNKNIRSIFKVTGFDTFLTIE